MWQRITTLFDERALEPEMLRLIDGSETGMMISFVAVLAAAGIGVVHAVGPGHGKALIGAYLASTRGRPRDAVALGALVALMHTTSVLVLGLVLQATRHVPNLVWLEPVLMLVSALAVTAVGVVLVRRQRTRHHTEANRALAGVGVSDPDRGGHGGEAQHHHHGHSHELPTGVPPLSRAGIVALATSGGLVPSPAAFVVLATAMAIGRTAFGLALVAAFGVGLAVTLTAVGLAVLWGRGRVERGSGRPRWLVRLAGRVPVVAAWLVLGGGLALVVAAVLRL